MLPFREEDYARTSKAKMWNQLHTFSFNKASETGLLGRTTAGGVIEVSGILEVSYSDISYYNSTSTQLIYHAALCTRVR